MQRPARFLRFLIIGDEADKSAPNAFRGTLTKREISKSIETTLSRGWCQTEAEILVHSLILDSLIVGE